MRRTSFPPLNLDPQNCAGKASVPLCPYPTHCHWAVAGRSKEITCMSISIRGGTVWCQGIRLITLSTFYFSFISILLSLSSWFLPLSYFQFLLFCPLYLNWAQHVANLCSGQIPNFHIGLQNVGVEGTIEVIQCVFLFPAEIQIKLSLTWLFRLHLKFLNGLCLKEFSEMYYKNVLSFLCN